tara:strand:+ start:692 stop:976 length:285 start_codon:yes stop_codon:yes gene_type:complete
MTKPLITRIKAEKAVTQLLCLIIGGKQANASSHLFRDVSERLEFCLRLVHQEMKASIHDTDPDRFSRVVSTAKTKLESIQSLKTLNQLIEEVEW